MMTKYLIFQMFQIIIWMLNDSLAVDYRVVYEHDVRLRDKTSTSFALRDAILP